MKKGTKVRGNPGGREELEDKSDDVLIEIVEVQAKVIASLSRAVVAMASATEFRDDDGEDEDEEGDEDKEDDEGSKG